MNIKKVKKIKFDFEKNINKYTRNIWKYISLKIILFHIINFSFSFIFKFFIWIIAVLIIRLINNIDNKKFKVCLCTIAKGENKYIKEFVDYYKNYGVDKIFLYDNNDRNGERFQNILSEYIKNNFLRVINIRGKKKMQIDSFNHCNWINYYKYNWMLLFDVDEFIYLKNYSNIKTFLNDKKFDKCKAIHLNELIHTDNNQLYYQNKSVIERFPEINYNRTPIMIKSILKGRTKHTRIVNNHVIHFNWEGCDGQGNKIQFKDIYTQHPDFKNYYFNHYFSKSAEEYLIKIAKGSVFWGNVRYINKGFLSLYFDYNKLTEAKINFFTNKTGIDLTTLRERLKGK